MLSLVIWFSEGLVSVRSEVGLSDLGGLFQPRQFCDSVFYRVMIFTVGREQLSDSYQVDIAI